MVVNRRKKHLKFRGHRAQGYGSHKKHRGGGSQGGKGRAGLHKHKWSYVVKYEPDAFGKFGFKRPEGTVKEVVAVNVRQLDEQIEKLLQEKFAVKEGDAIKIDVSKIGFDKVLGSGRITKKLIVEAKSFSDDAKKKIEEAGGQAIVSAKEKKAVKEEMVKGKTGTKKVSEKNEKKEEKESKDKNPAKKVKVAKAVKKKSDE